MSDLRKHLDTFESGNAYFYGLEFKQAMDLLRQSEAREKELLEELAQTKRELATEKYLCAETEVNADKAEAEVERLTGMLEALKVEVGSDANFGKIVELLFYAPLREAGAENKRLAEDLKNLYVIESCGHLRMYELPVEYGNTRCSQCLISKLAGELEAAGTEIKHLEFVIRELENPCSY